MDNPQDEEAITLTVGYGISLYACMACGHYMHADTASSALALMRCGQCGCSLMRAIRSEQDIHEVKQWLDTQMLMESWRGPMTPRIH